MIGLDEAALLHSPGRHPGNPSLPHPAKPWAIQLWRRARLIAVIYALVVLAAGIIRLIFGWDDIYG